MRQWRSEAMPGGARTADQASRLDGVPLTLLAGPANAGKVALLLDRYAADLERDPVLVVPNRAEAQRVERDLLAAGGAVIGGSIGTFDDLFERIARSNGGHRRVVTDTQRAMIVRRVAAAAAGPSLGRAARFSGFADTLAATLAELESGLVEPHEIGGELGGLQGAYRAELKSRQVWDRDRERRYAAERVAGELEAWDGRPVYAYGFEDLTGVQWALIRALAGRSDVTVSLPYEPGELRLARSRARPQHSRRPPQVGSKSSRLPRTSTRDRRLPIWSVRFTPRVHRLHRRSKVPYDSSKPPARGALWNW